MGLWIKYLDKQFQRVNSKTEHYEEHFLCNTQSPFDVVTSKDFLRLLLTWMIEFYIFQMKTGHFQKAGGFYIKQWYVAK